MRPTLFLVLVAVTICVWGCSASGNGLISLVPAGQELSQGERDNVYHGRALAMTECTQCHRLYRPEEFPPEKWPQIIRKMGQRASLSSQQTNDVISYYTSTGRTGSAK